MTDTYFLTLYFALNIVLGACYLGLRVMLAVPVMNRRILQRQRLSISRWVFMVAFVVFFVVQGLSHWSPWQYHFHEAFYALMQVVAMDIFEQVAFTSANIVQPVSGHMVQFSYANLLVILFLFCFIFLLLRHLFVLRQLDKLYQRAFLYRKIGSVRICLSDEIKVPFCYSMWLRSAIILPKYLLLQPHNLRIALAHELQHIRHKDTFWIQVFHICRAFCFFNPFVYHWSRWQSDLREYACDEAIILKNKYSQLTYGKCLFAIAQQSYDGKEIPGTVAMLPILLANDRNLLKSRIKRLFSYTRVAKSKLFMLVISVFIVIATFSLVYFVDDEENLLSVNASQIESLDNLLQ
jgi:beta-lactamase regulating signal transducer with metallopeptidase domain